MKFCLTENKLFLCNGFGMSVVKGKTHSFMTKFFIVVASSFFVVLLAIILNSCVKDNCKRTYTYSYYVPAYKTTAEIKAGIKNDAARKL